MSATLPRSPVLDTAEGRRLAGAEAEGWRRWGPYLAERQWGTVREDYSADGDAWAYLPHDHARSRAYRWGEDGIAGFCNEGQHWCLSLGLWNGADAILKERLFGLTNAQGNHGEDVKELWWHLDAVPSHSWQRMLYRYPQGAFPYEQLIEENARRRGSGASEYELEDTGILDGDRFFDVTVDYAKAAPDDILLAVTIVNRGPQTRAIHVLPQLVARNIWSWTDGAPRPSITPHGPDAVLARHPALPDMRLEALQTAQWLFCENETNRRRLYGTSEEGAFKDAINDHVVGGGTLPLPASGTKCAALSVHSLDPGASLVLRYRFAPAAAGPLDPDAFDEVRRTRRAEADAFYDALQADIGDADARLVQRRALAGLLWSKQVYRRRASASRRSGRPASTRGGCRAPGAERDAHRDRRCRSEARHRIHRPRPGAGRRWRRRPGPRAGAPRPATGGSAGSRVRRTPAHGRTRPRISCRGRAAARSACRSRDR